MFRFWVGLLFIGIIFAGSIIHADRAPIKIYFVSGAHDHYKWKLYPFQPRSIFEILRIWGDQIHGNIIDDLPSGLEKTDIIGVIYERWISRKIEKQIRILKKKGYDIIYIEKIEVTELFKILSSPETLAVFHGGHSYSPDDFSGYDLIYNGKGETYISVFDGKNKSALTDEVADKVLTGSPSDYKASENIKIFFSSACYAGYCELPLRAKLRLSNHTKFMSPKNSWNPERPADLTSFKDIAASFSNEVAKWVSDLRWTPFPGHGIQIFRVKKRGYFQMFLATKAPQFLRAHEYLRWCAINKALMFSF